MSGRDREPGGDDGAGDAQAQGHPENRGQRGLPHQGRGDHRDVTSHWPQVETMTKNSPMIGQNTRMTPCQEPGAAEGDPGDVPDPGGVRGGGERVHRRGHGHR